MRPSGDNPVAELEGRGMDAIVCESLRRVYKSRSILGQVRETVALDELTMTVPQGAVFGLLGPNGAGKTTTVRMLSTLLTPTAGRATVLGADVAKQASEVRKHIGLVLGGDRGLYGRLTGRENLRYFGALNHMDPGVADRRIAYLLEMVGLADRPKTLVEEYSRGMRQRLHLARGLLTDPDVLFLDEPTIGLDPIGAQEVRQMVPVLAAEGKTILLTTHYMFEADSLCDTIAIINLGKLVALGSPTTIKRRFSKVVITEVTLREARAGIQDEIAALPSVRHVDVGSDEAFQKLTVHSETGADVRGRIAGAVGEANIERLVVREPTLEEAYISLLK